MFRYFTKRLILLLPVVIFISILIFAIVKIMPGDPVALMMPDDLTPEQYEATYQALHKELGLDDGLVTQYFSWIGSIFQGEFGYSYNRPVSMVIGEPLRNTLILNLGVNALYLLIAIPVGILCAVKRMSWFDQGWQAFSLVAYSTPAFFLAILLIYLFSVTLGWLPMGGMPNGTLLSGAAPCVDSHLGSAYHHPNCGQLGRCRAICAQRHD